LKVEKFLSSLEREKRRFLIEKGHNECQKSMLRARVKEKKKDKKKRDIKP
jgi:hypothetical protein